MSEILNIEYHTCRLVVKALNKYARHSKAADALQISRRHLYNYIDQFKIEKCATGYQSKKKIPVATISTSL